MEKTRLETGMAARRKVLGDAFTDKYEKSIDDYGQPLAELVSEYCWGTVWSRPGLALKTRSFLNLGMLIALNRPHELKTHLLGAINNGLTREEIREVILQAAVYCGVPAAVDAMRVTKEFFAELDKKP